MRARSPLAATLTLLLSLLALAPVCGARGRIRLATTTSVENSGLLAAILPAFERASGLKVEVLPVGSGKALELGRRGDVDAVLAHSPAAEEAFVAQGYGRGRVAIMRNWFLIVGPTTDPARVKGLAPVEAVHRIAAAGALFVSRGDESGTHVKERELWAKAGVRPQGERYLEVGRGMAETLFAASEKRAYTLADRATFLFVCSRLDLVPLVEHGGELENVYSVMWVDPVRAPGARDEVARQLVAWLQSASGQRAIGEYRIAGERVFEPLVGR